MRSLSDKFVLLHSLLHRSVYFFSVSFVLMASLGANTAYALPLPVLPDPALQVCLDEQAAVNVWLNAEDVTAFNCVGRGVQLIHGIEAFTNLKELDLSDNQIVDIFPLNVHTGLTTLRLSGNSGIDFNLLFPIIDQNNDLTRLGLGGITLNGSLPVFLNQMTMQPYQLIELDLSQTGLNDLFGIEQYSTLQILNVSTNNISDIAPLAFGPTGPLPLSDLDLSHNQVFDVNPLSSINALTRLDLSGNSGIDFNFLFPIIDQNNELTRLGLGGIAINGPLPVFMNPMTGQPYQLEELNVSQTGLTDLFGIELYSTLQVLDASNNNLVDITPFTLGLEPLPLIKLDLSNNRIVDVNPLSAGGFIDLSELDLSGNSGIDFNQVSAIIHNNTGLTRLGLGDIAINGPLPIFMNSLTGQPLNLIELNVRNTGLVGLYGIDQYPNLQILEASNNQLDDIAPLVFGWAGPLPLRELDLSNNQIVDVNPLSHLSGLTRLNLSGNSKIDFNILWPIIDQNNGLTRLGLGDIAINGPLPVFMNQMTWQPYQLIELNVNSTGLKELLGIEQYSTLQILDAANNELVDIAPLAFGPTGPLPLRELNLSNNQIVDVHHLSSFTELTHLDLSGNSSIDFNLLFPVIDQNNGLTRLGLGDIAINGPLPIFMNQVTGQPYDLVELNVNNTGIKDLLSIEQYGALRLLDAANNQIVDIAPLAFGPTGLLPLRELDLSSNQIMDVSPLTNLTSLTRLNLSGNGGIDFNQLFPIIDQNNGLTRLGLGDITINGPLPVFIDQMTWQPYDLVELNVNNTGLQDLFGIEQYVSLRILDAANNQIVDISPLAFGPIGPLPLRELDLSNNLIVDVNPLSSFTGLTYLDLSGNSDIDFGLLFPVIEQNNSLTRLGLGDIAIHGSLPIFMNYLTGQPYGLVELNVNNTGIKDLFGIELYSTLQILEAADNEIVDIAPLAFGPTGPLPLRELDLSNNLIVDVNPLNSFMDLTTLRVSGNSGIDFGYLFPILDQNNGLTRLGLGGIAINGSLPPLFNQMNGWKPYDLVELDVSHTGLVDVYGIEQYQSLQTLDASNNNLVDISSLAFGPKGPLPLRELDLSHNQIIDVNPLTYFTDLTYLNLSGNNGIDFNQLFPVIDQNNGLTRLGLGDIAINGPLPVFMNQTTWQPYDLVELDVNNTGLQDLFGIEQYVSLRILDAANNHIVDISPLAFGPIGPLPLRELDLSNNLIVDVNPLTNFTGLTRLDLSGNSGIDFNQLFPIIDKNNGLTRLGLKDITISGPLPVFMNQVTGQPYELVELNVSNTGLVDVYGIEQYQDLQILDAANNYISDIAPLAYVTMGVLPLRELNLSHNQIVDVNPLINFTGLTRLDLSGNSDIDFNQLLPVIDQNNNLVRLGLGGIAINGPLPVFMNRMTWQPYDLIELNVSNTGIQGLFGIEQYSHLQILDASNNALFDIAPLQYGVNGPLPLRELNLSNNQIVEVIPLSTLVTLNSLDLTGNTAIPCDQLDYLVISLGQDVVIRPESCVVGLPPTINIIYPYNGYTFFEGEMVKLSVDAYDPETGNLSHAVQWSSNVSGQLGTGALIYVQLLPGDQEITATIVDSDNNSATSSVSISVLANNAPTLNIHSPYVGQTIVEGQALNAFADAFDVEDGGLIHQVVWTSNIDGSLGVGADIPLTLSVGSHVITATVTDRYGKSASQSVTVNVVFNNLPVVIITSPITGSSTIEGAPLNLTVIATDVEDGMISDRVRWHSDLQGELGTGASVPVNLIVGTHTLSATVTDNLGKTTTQNSTITVEFNNPPTLNITNPVSGSSIIEGSSLNLIAAANDMEDGDLSTLISWSSDLQGELGVGPNVTTNLVVGDHVLTASVVDAHGKVTSQTTTLSVVFNNPPVITLATETVNQSIEDGLSVILSASAIDVEDGDISTVIQWSSDIVGNLGTGNNLSVVLPVGNHQLTATVSDLQGKQHSLATQLSVTEAPVLAYCDSNGLLADRQWIQSISITGTENISASQGGYGDYWNNGPIYLNRTANQLILEPGFHNAPDNVTWYVWIDLNRDGVFADDERVFKNRTSVIVNTSFDLPASAISGNTRMRISMKRRRSNSACGEFRRGEVEDYRVIIQP